jgi:hypothetical protein
MKAFLFAALIGVVASTSAIAQSAPSSMHPAASDGAVSRTGQTSASQQGSWTPPYGQAIVPKTRAQVYQELVEAEKDGQLQYLDSTLYAHH